jgi:hypothetical protein
MQMTSLLKIWLRTVSHDRDLFIACNSHARRQLIVSFICRKKVRVGVLAVFTISTHQLRSGVPTNVHPIPPLINHRIISAGFDDGA